MASCCIQRKAICIPPAYPTSPIHSTRCIIHIHGEDVLLERLAGHLQVVVPFGLRQFGEVHKAGVLPLVVITDLGREKQVNPRAPQAIQHPV